jgi:hypothetical protein
MSVSSRVAGLYSPLVVDVPDWDIFNGPKEITRSKRKHVLFEEAIV